MTKKRKRFFTRAGAILIALAAVVSLSIFVRTTYLVLTNDSSGAVLYRVRLNEGDEFSISFIHSVNISPVTEIYEIRQGEIVLTVLEFYTFGAGMPTQIEPYQTLVRLPDGGMRVEGFDRVIGNLRYIIGHTAGQTLNAANREILLTDLDEAGQTVLFAVRRLNIWQRVIMN